MISAAATISTSTPWMLQLICNDPEGLFSVDIHSMAWIVLDGFTCASRSTIWISLQIVPRGESRSHCTTQTNMHQEPRPAHVHKTPFTGFQGEVACPDLVLSDPWCSTWFTPSLERGRPAHRLRLGHVGTVQCCCRARCCFELIFVFQVLCTFIGNTKTDNEQYRITTMALL